MKRLLATLLASLTFGASAHSPTLVDLEVVDRDTGRLAPVYHQRGQTYVAGEPGHRYAVRLVNKTGGRVLAVLSVDGVNAVSGETASAHQAGYVLSPYESAEINGWRKSLDDVAQFVFSAPESSYAARTGRPQNVGVIGVAVYQEQFTRPRPLPPVTQPRYPRGDWRRDKIGANQDSAPAPEAPSMRSEEAESSKRYGEGLAGQSAAPDLGTAHGQREWAPVGTTEFRRRSSRPDEVVSLQYRSPEFLVDNGIAPPCSFGYGRGCRPTRGQPEAFPLGFVPDPY
ncbi:MAG: hypothetical protein IPK97_02750 [Ahniella sp.]|nr:hypothetical protein [Ahniella sp.]